MSSPEHGTQQWSGPEPHTPWPPQESLPAPRRPRWPWITGGAVAVVAAVIVIALAAGGAFRGTPAPTAPTTFTLHGSLQLVSGYSSYGNAVIAYDLPGCEGTGAYGDLVAGTAVVIAGPQGQQVAVGSLRIGTGDSANCSMPFDVANVPLGLASYSVTISHRGTQVETPQAAQADVELSIGGN